MAGRLPRHPGSRSEAEAIRDPLSVAAGLWDCDKGAEARRGEDRAVPDDHAANGSRLCGRFAPLAGMTRRWEFPYAIALPFTGRRGNGEVAAGCLLPAGR